MDGFPVRRPESEQPSARIRRLTEIAGMVFGEPGAADAWLAASRPDLGGLRPAELAAYGEDGSRWRCRCSSGEIGGEPETMADIVSGGRVGGFVVFTDEDGLRHAVRPGAVLTLSDGDDMGEITMMQMPGNRAVLIRRRLDEVLEWFG